MDIYARKGSRPHDVSYIPLSISQVPFNGETEKAEDSYNSR